jgi:beta-lactamase regulating signal transducer with metallopeptidase domain
MGLLFYLLEANVYLCILYLFYRLMLRKETFYLLNRWYLIATVFVSFSLPFIRIQQSSTASGDFTGRAAITINDRAPGNLQHNVTYPISGKPASGIGGVIADNAATIACILYALVIFFGLLKLLQRIKTIFTLFYHSPKYKEGGITHIYIREEREAFSFFNWLFYHPDLKPDRTIISHEMVHIRQKHSADVLLFELFSIVNWINPLLRLMCRDVKLNHEFLADQAACRQTISKHAYAMLLIGHAGRPDSPKISSGIFNSQQLEQRIIQLTAAPSRKRQKLKYLLTLALLVPAIFLSSFAMPKSYALLRVQMGSDANGLNTHPPVIVQARTAVADTLPQAAEHPQKARSNTNTPIAADRSLRNRSSGYPMQKAARDTNPPDVYLNGVDQGVPMNSHTIPSDTIGILTVKPEYMNGQVSISRSPADTVHPYSVQPIHQNGQVRMNLIRTGAQ